MSRGSQGFAQAAPLRRNALPVHTLAVSKTSGGSFLAEEPHSAMAARRHAS